MKKRYILNFRTRTITTYLDGAHVGVISFAEALTYQRNIVRMWLAAVHRQQFAMVEQTSDGAFVYEKWVQA
jgi:hypothetical protein